MSVRALAALLLITAPASPPVICTNAAMSICHGGAAAAAPASLLPAASVAVTANDQIPAGSESYSCARPPPGHAAMQLDGGFGIVAGLHTCITHAQHG